MIILIDTEKHFKFFHIKTVTKLIRQHPYLKKNIFKEKKKSKHHPKWEMIKTFPLKLQDFLLDALARQ